MERSWNLLFRPFLAGAAGTLLILMLGAPCTLAEELPTDDGKVTSGDPVDVLDFGDPDDPSDDVQAQSMSSTPADQVLVIVVPGFRHQNFLLIVEIRDGLPRIRFEEMRFPQRRLED